MQIIVSAAALSINKRPLWPASRVGAQLLLARGGSASLSFSLYFVASSLIPLGDAAAICNAYPILTVLGASLWLDEPVGVVQGVSLLTCTAGLWLLAQSAEAAFDVTSTADQMRMGYTAAGFSAALATGFFLSTRLAGGRFDPLQGTLTQGCFTAIVGMVMHLSHGGTAIRGGLSLGVALQAFAVACLWLSANALLSFAVPHCRAGISSMLLTTEIVWAYAWQISVMHQAASAAASVGAGLVLLSICAPRAAALNESPPSREALEKARPELAEPFAAVSDANDSGHQTTLLSVEQE